MVWVARIFVWIPRARAFYCIITLECGPGLGGWGASIRSGATGAPASEGTFVRPAYPDNQLGFRIVAPEQAVRQLSPVRPRQTPQIVGVFRALSCFRTAAAELPTLSIARANSSLLTPKCRVQYLT